MVYRLYSSYFQSNLIFAKFTNSTYLINTISGLYLMIDLKMLCLILSYNLLVSTIIYLQKLEIRNIMNSKSISSIINSSSTSLLGSIINKNYMYGGGNTSKIALKKLFYAINKNY